MDKSRNYKKIELKDLTSSNCPKYVAITGIARGSRQEHNNGVYGNPHGFYSGLLQSTSDENFCVYISGMVRNEDNLGDVLSMLRASSETGLPITIRGSSRPHPRRPSVHHIAEIDFCNLKYECIDKRLI